MWAQVLGDGQIGRRDKVQYVLSGQARYFRRWSELQAFAQECLPGWEMEESEEKEEPKKGGQICKTLEPCKSEQ